MAFCNKFNKFNNTFAQMLDSIYHDKRKNPTVTLSKPQNRFGQNITCTYQLFANVSLTEFLELFHKSNQQ